MDDADQVRLAPRQDDRVAHRQVRVLAELADQVCHAVRELIEPRDPLRQIVGGELDVAPELAVQQLGLRLQ